MPQTVKVFHPRPQVPAAVQAIPPPQVLAPVEGPRKLVRPQLPAGMHPGRTVPRRLRGSAPIAAHEGKTVQARTVREVASPAEALYFQKQMQHGVSLVFVLEDGERIQGLVEWFDRDCIKVRNETRTLIFKRSIKYLYKAGETGAPAR